MSITSTCKYLINCKLCLFVVSRSFSSGLTEVCVETVFLPTYHISTPQNPTKTPKNESNTLFNKNKQSLQLKFVSRTCRCLQLKFWSHTYAIENELQYRNKFTVYCIVLYCTDCTVLYCTVLYSTVLYCTVRYCTVPLLHLPKNQRRELLIDVSSNIYSLCRMHVLEWRHRPHVCFHDILYVIRNKVIKASKIARVWCCV